MIRKMILMLSLISGLLISINCTQADVASRNISEAAEEFEIYRRIVFFNGITDKYLLMIEGKCSIESRSTRLDATCKIDDGKYMKHHLGLSDNVSYFSEQIEASNVSTKHYRVVFRPSVIVPNIDSK